MSIFSKSDSGVGNYRTFFPLKEKVDADIPIGRVVPVYADMVLPGDIWHLKQQILIRSHPMFAPLLTNIQAKVRAWFVPLRLVDDNAEFIITGSKNGKVGTYDENGKLIPFQEISFKGLFDDVDSSVTGYSYAVDKYSALDYMFSMPVGDYANTYTNDGIPAQYWLKAYERIWFDYYRDENLSDFYEFDTYWDTLKIAPGKVKPFYANWRKDYFTACLPFQQKGIRPTFDFNLVNPDDFTTFFGLNGLRINSDLIQDVNGQGTETPVTVYSSGDNISGVKVKSDQTSAEDNIQKVQYTVKKGTYVNPAVPEIYLSKNNYNDGTILGSFTYNQSSVTPGIDFAGLASTLGVDDLRLVTQIQRILERASRAGSRYTEYLYSTFGVSPKDETLQRVQYLGGYSQPIVVSQVEQTAADGANPVGTLRGKGISLSDNAIPTFIAKEFGCIFVTLEIMPESIYGQGIRKKYTLKSRYDFYNPSFQFLSEEEIKNSEIYWEFDNSVVVDGKPINNATFGFLEMYSYLKSNQHRAAGELRDTLAYWNIVRKFSNTPVLSETFIQGQDSQAFAAPFAITDAPPFICEFYNHNGVYRPMAKYGTPGRIDHS